MGKKMPRNTGMALQFEIRTLSESSEKNDTVVKCLKRIKLLLQEKREHMRLSNEAGPDEYCSVIDEKDKILSNAAPTAAVKTPQFPNSSAKCQACGMFNHTRKFCAFKNHELANRTTHQWDYSPRGKLWATHHKPCLTIGYALPGHQPIQHSDGNYPKPNPYAKSNSQTNSSNGKYRQYNNNDNSNRNNNNSNNANRDNSSGYNNNRDHNRDNNRDRSTDRSVDRSVNNDNNRSSTYFDNVNKKPRSKSDTDFSAICSAVTIPVLTEYLNVTV
jgi:hypothetical protein